MLRASLLTVAIGLLGGFVAGKWQIATLRFGWIGADQAFAFWKFFLTGGVGLAAVGALLGGGLGAVIRRGRTLVAVAGAAGAVAAGAALFVPGNVRDMPHVFLVVTDTTRADHLSLYGYDRKTTPFLEEMAGRSVVFSTAMSQGPHTIVTTPCILASLYPSDHGVVDYTSVLWDGFLLVSEILQRRGYSTLGVVTNPHLSKRNGFDQGFDTYQMLGSGTSVAVFAEKVNQRALVAVDSLRAASAGAAAGRVGEDGEVGEEGGLDSASVPPTPPAPPAEGSRPIFGFLFYTDPHGPYKAPPEYQSLYDPGWEGTPLYTWNWKKKGDPDARSLRNVIANYDATITYWDDQFRALSDSLDARGMLDNSLFIYTSDHGEEFWEHGNVGHGQGLFDEIVHVPLLFSLPVPVRRPELPRTTRVVDDVVSSVDIVPTLVEYLRIPVGHEMRGRSAMNLALGREDGGEERVAFLELLLKQYGTFDVRALRTKTRKCIVVQNYDTKFSNLWAPGDFFFDLEEDPGEQVNLIASGTEEVESYRERVMSWIREANERESREVETFVPGEDQLEQLKALGYVE